MSFSLSQLEFRRNTSMPVILQVEASECGLACLCMILCYYGHRIDLATLRRRYPISNKGVTLRTLIATADTVGLTSRAVRLDLDDLANLQLPCILHWGMNHFVVLTKIRGNQVTLHDPALGRRTLSPDVVSREFTGIALEVTPNESFKKEDQRETLRLRDMFRRIAGLRPALVILGILSLGLEVIALFMPMVSQIIIDEVVVTSDKELLTTIAVGVVLLLFIRLFIGCVRQWSVLILSSKVGLQWNVSLFDHLSRLPLDYFSKRHVGDVLSRFNSIGIIQKTITTDMVQAVMDGLMAAGMAAMLFLYGGWLGLVAFIATGLDVLLRLFTYQAYRETSEEQIVVEAKQQSHFIETLRGMASVKLLGLRERRRSAWTNLLVDSINIHIRLQRYDLIYERLSELIFGLDRLALLVLGALSVMKSSMTVGMLVAFLAYKDEFASRVARLIHAAFELRMLNVQTDRLSDIVLTNTETTGKTPSNFISVPALTAGGTLSCKALSARYGQHEPWIFHNIDLTISAGECVAFVGQSGCGKTTFLKSLMGLMVPEEGHISLDGVDIEALTLDVYRSRIAGVLQDDGLFSGSIAENISGFAEEVDQEWLVECAAKTAILQDIQKMPMGFETLVGDMGTGLSGGQKQRIILARALYRKPEVLFLDEATSHLDPETEQHVADALRTLNITRVMVAHRPATIAHADKVYLFQAGGLLTECGWPPE